MVIDGFFIAKFHFKKKWITPIINLKINALLNLVL